MISFDVNQRTGATISHQRWQRWLRAIERGAKLKKSTSVSVAVVGDAAMKRLNKAYRGKNSVTDVLSFGERDGARTPDAETGFLGEIIICYPQAVRQARELSHSLDDELAWLVTHGFLHLLGHDHERPQQARAMKGLEKKILLKL